MFQLYSPLCTWIPGRRIHSHRSILGIQLHAARIDLWLAPHTRMVTALATGDSMVPITSRLPTVPGTQPLTFKRQTLVLWE
uniref:Uncharacterized protein n=1 Tax=Knipowitschia caucasica TaxID=637954 RepID=A0AAV2MBK6_KNICA